MQQNQARTEIRLKGIPVSPGVVLAQIAIIRREEFRVVAYEIKTEEIGAELERFEKALVQTREQIQEIERHISSSIGEKDASIFEAHLLVLEDVTIVEAVKKQLHTELRNVEHIYNQIVQSYVRSMRELDDPYLQERAADLIDVGRRVLNNLMGKKMDDIYRLSSPSIILAHDLTPSDTALLDRARVLGFSTETGSTTSHTAIMARALNIPAVVGIKGALKQVKDPIEVLLDGHEGLLILNPTDKTKYEYGQIERQRSEVKERLRGMQQVQAVTTDGHRIIVAANIELTEELELLESSGAEGIGLYRTEMLYLNRNDIPSEQEQFEVYRQVIASAGAEGAIVRTIDLGADKMPASIDMGNEMNPFLGWRAIRYCLQQVDVFKTQLRAICRAADGYKARIMFPMIATVDELLKSKEILQEVVDQMRESGEAHASHIEVGMMIEVPSAAITVDQFVDHVDFFSIGTNDLVGYSLAMDRTNERVSYLYQPTHPAVLRMIRRVVDTAHANNRWVGVCGETAGDVRLTPMFVGLGVDELSMGSIFIPRIKRAVQCLHQKDMRRLVDECCGINSASNIQQRFLDVAHYFYPDLLI